MKNLKVLILTLVILMNSDVIAHPTGGDSILDQNIVSIDIMIDLNIPPNSKQIELVRLGRSYCVLNMHRAEGYDRSIKASNLSVLSVIPYSVTEPEGNGFSSFYDDYVIFNIGNKKKLGEIHPEIESVLCGYDVTRNGKPLTISYNSGWSSNLRRRYGIPSFNQLNSDTSSIMNFQRGETIDITGQ